MRQTKARNSTSSACDPENRIPQAVSSAFGRQAHKELHSNAGIRIQSGLYLPESFYAYRCEGSGEAGFSLQMRPYMILRLASGIFFACRRCDFRVKVERRNGLARTIAAATMNDHIRANHPEPEPQMAEFGIR
jgi:hypothetical protein